MTTRSLSRTRQRGVTLIVGLIMLVLISLMVTTAFTLSTSNLKSVGNMQFRNESIAAANKAIEQIVTAPNFSAGFTTIPANQTITYDINGDGTIDYNVAVAQPVCVSAETVGAGGAGTCSGFRLGGSSSGACGVTNYSTLWDIKATVTDVISGSSVVVRQGMRVEVGQAQLSIVCP